MAGITIPTKLTEADWDKSMKAWRCPALRVPGAVIAAVFIDGSRTDKTNYEALPDQGFIRWIAAKKPVEALVSIELTEALSKEVDTDRWKADALSKQKDKKRLQLLAIILPVFGAIVGALITSLVPVLVPSTHGGATPPAPAPPSEEFVLRSWTFAEVPPYGKEDLYQNVELQEDGGRISGAVRAPISGTEWKIRGYKRDKFLGLAYGGVKIGGLGTGTHTMQQDIDDIYWGYAVKVECIGPDALLVRCPAVMFRRNHSELEKTYANFLMRECERVTLDPPQSCKAVEQH
jgi:hypothetical protein